MKLSKAEREFIVCAVSNLTQPHLGFPTSYVADRSRPPWDREVAEGIAKSLIEKGVLKRVGTAVALTKDIGIPQAFSEVRRQERRSRWGAYALAGVFFVLGVVVTKAVDSLWNRLDPPPQVRPTTQP